MDADPDLDGGVRAVPDADGGDGGEEVEGHGGHLPGVAQSVPDGQAAHHHVGVADRLHLVHVVVLDDGVKARVQVVQHVHDLKHTHDYDLKRFHNYII